MESIELIRILDELKLLKNSIDTIKTPIATKKPHRSTEIHELATALSKAQAEFEVAALNKANPYFKSRYADFMSVVMASRPALSKNGLAVIQDIITDEDGMTMMHTILLHTTGQYIESRMRVVPPKNDIQSMASYITYLKRMAYASLVGVVTGDEDDDGEYAMAESRELYAKGTALNTKYNPKEISPETITKEQLEELNYELAEYPDIAEMILEGMKIQSLADLPKSKFLPSIERIRQIKNIRNGKNK